MTTQKDVYDVSKDGSLGADQLPIKETDSEYSGGSNKIAILSITGSKRFENFSLEEIRAIDYTNYNTGVVDLAKIYTENQKKMASERDGKFGGKKQI